MIFANQLGGQDDLIFDGASFAFNADKNLAFQMSQFEEQLIVTTWRRGPNGWVCSEGPMSRIPGRRGSELPRLHAGSARLRQQEWLQGCRARPFRWHQLGDLCRARGRRTGRRTPARCHDALYLYVEGLAEGRRGLRPHAWLPLRYRADLRAGPGLPQGACVRHSRAPRKA